jgi:hypothetical protein
MIVNKVEKSGIITLDLEAIIPEGEISYIDIKDNLFQGLILREKDFRQWVKENDWTPYENNIVSIYCSVDAIVPTWAYMLVTTALNNIASEVYFCKPDELALVRAERLTGKLDFSQYADKRIVIKGCGDREIHSHAFVSLTERLLPLAKTIMYGEPCSTVPVYKKR